MPKKKLIHFRENLTFPHLFQPSYTDLLTGFPLRGKWHADCFGNDHPIIVELGCGKGEYTVGLAIRHPERNYIGIDWKGARLWRGCKAVQEKGLMNAAFVRMMIGNIGYMFGKGEVSGIWITFPDPQVKKERLRLTSPGFLAKYAEILSPGASLHLKTDDHDFYAYSLEVIRSGDHKLLYASDDVYDSRQQEDAVAIQTYYEERWLEIGKKICYVEFQLKNT